MWLSLLALVLSTEILPASGAVVKTGSTCVVTSLSEDAAAVGTRSIGAVSPAERDLGGLWDALDPYADPKPGMPGALGHYPRPEPSRERRDSPYSPDEAEAGAEAPSSYGLQGPPELLENRQNRIDDTPQILDAFRQCGKDGTIIFREGTYHIRQVMDTTDLRNCSVEIHGTFVWSADNLSYWRQRSFPVTYAGRSTAWLLGGRDVSLRGFGKALFDGNGQAWIDLARGQGNLDGRPISLTVWHGTNILIDGISWRMAQFWHTFVAHSQNVTMTNLDMRTYSTNSHSSVNTDGTNTWNSRDVFISNWTVLSGDVSIFFFRFLFLSFLLSFLPSFPLDNAWNNRRNPLTRENCRRRRTGLHRGQGQQQQRPREQHRLLRVGRHGDRQRGVQRVAARLRREHPLRERDAQPLEQRRLDQDVPGHRLHPQRDLSQHPLQRRQPAHLRHLVHLYVLFSFDIRITQLTTNFSKKNKKTDSYQNCDSSRLAISDIRWENITGTSRYNVAAGMHCSAAAPCDGFHFSGIDIRPKDGGTAKVLCSNIRNQATMGLDCTGPCPGSHPQQLSGNVWY